MRKFLLKEYETAGRICLVCFLRGRRFRDCSRGKFCIFRVVNVFIPKLMPEKRFKATKKRFNKHWFLKITSQRRYEKHRTCFGSTQPPFFSLTKNFKVEVIPAIILVCWCPQTQLVFKFLKSFFFFFPFFLKIHRVPIYFEIELNQPLTDAGDPVDVPAAFAEHRPAPTAQRQSVCWEVSPASPWDAWAPQSETLGMLSPRVPVIRAGRKEHWFGAVLSLDKWDWICDFVAQSQGYISKASNKSPRRIEHFSGRLEEIWSFLLCSE